MRAEDIKTVSVIGAGLMGHGIAQIFASRGYEVSLLDITDEILAKSIGNIRANLALMAQSGLVLDNEIDTIIGRIRTTTCMNDIKEAQLIIEAVTENLPLKQDTFQELDNLCPPGTILATNTSVIRVTEIAAKARYQERIVGTHFWNPPYLIPLVEVIKGDRSSAEVIETTCRVLRKAGKHPVNVSKDVPGFIGNRLQHALWREAISIVANGIADPAAVDDVIKKGLGIRLPVLGPLENADMVGLDLTLAIHEYVLKHIDSFPGPSPLLREKVEKGELGFKAGDGFYKWSPEEMENSRRRLLEHLLELTLKQKGEK
jgi:3-hydroxybutyryl-CoA dehydrogenase